MAWGDGCLCVIIAIAERRVQKTKFIHSKKVKLFTNDIAYLLPKVTCIF